MSESETIKVEINSNFVKAKDSFSANGHTVLFTPPVGEDYWTYRVRLKKGQAILAFPKFGMLGCGFAKESDWNTNLPLSCGAVEIYEHIKHNKKYREITRDQCIEAIKAIQKVAEENRE